VYYNRYVVKKTETAATLWVRKKRGIGAEIWLQADQRRSK
jgi:hypothetical protein